MNEDQAALERFTGVARLFPLPNVVLFPCVLQPLHIFEPRYRQMTADALAGDRLMAMALLQPGWEADYEGQPAIYPAVCLGRILSEQRLPDGRFNILLRGLSRARVVQEVPGDRLYRQAQLQLLPDTGHPVEAVARSLRQDLGKLAQPWFAPQGPARAQLTQLLQGNLPLGVLADILTFALPLAVDIRQQTLEEAHVERRVRLLLAYLQVAQPPEGQGETVRKFPPDFSEN